MYFPAQIQPYAHTPITRHLLLALLGGYRRPNDKISELIRQGYLVPLRRGLFVAGPQAGLALPEAFLIANYLRGPSYVSMESALAFWGLIPERVFETTSASLKPSKRYATAVGRFRYKQLALPYYSYGIRREALAPQQFGLVASPEKALCDKIVTTAGVTLRSIPQTQALLLQDLRMDVAQLKRLDLDAIAQWLNHSPKRASLEMLLKTLHAL